MQNDQHPAVKAAQLYAQALEKSSRALRGLKMVPRRGLEPLQPMATTTSR